MGLDTFASRSPDDVELTEEDHKTFEDAEISLCGGVFSGDGSDGSFRGKVYAMTILEITGESLYQEWIPPETVREMYHALTTNEGSKWQEDQGDHPTHREYLDLCTFFRICSERGLGLIGWS